jgi:4-amino-4-deoxy-L-arabinose transferase-like glycosyltransferase
MPTPDRPHGSADTRADRRLLAALAALPLVLHVAAAQSPHYGYFIDEFYYVACTKRLAFGYVDHPPLAVWLLALTRAALGDSVVAIRLAAFLAHGATIWLSGLLAQRLGGGRTAILVAGAAVGFSPILLAMSGFYSMNAFEPVLWLLIVLAVMRTVETGESRGWLAVGLLTGLALQNKHTAAAYVLALGAGMLATRTRRVVADRWLWTGAAVAALVVAPNVVWQAANGWPSAEFYRNAHLLKNVPAPPLESVVAQVLVNNPVTLPLWLAGLVSLLAGPAASRFRFIGIGFLVLLAMHVASGTSRPDRTAAAYPVLYAAGAVWLESGLRRLAASRPVLARSVPAAAVGLTMASAAALVPIALPVLPPPTLARYVAALGLNAQAERGKSSPIPQLLADRTGWESFVDDVARVYRELAPADQEKVLFYAPSYGQAGALELLGPSRGLPAGRVIGSQNTYWHWSVGRVNTDVLIAVDAGEDTLRHLFADVREAGRSYCEYCMSWRNDNPIHLARGSIATVESVWPRARHYE